MSPPVRAGGGYARRYGLFSVPAAVVVLAVIVLPWAFTLVMSLADWSPTGGTSWVGLANYAQLLTDPEFGWSVLRTFFFTAIGVIAPLVLGLVAALCFHEHFPLRGLARTVFILPMMATPVAIALVWSMMFHPQLGVLNYLLTAVGLPPGTWTYSETTVIPTLAMIETWQWTPLVMLILLGGLASLPGDPYEAARIDGATSWDCFRRDQILRHHLRHHPGWPRHRQRNDEHLSLSAGLRLLPPGLCLGGDPGVLHRHCRDHAGDAGPAAAGARGMNRNRANRLLNKAGLIFVVLVLLSPTIFVFFWMASLSLKNEVDNMAFPPVFIPHIPTLANYTKVFAQYEFGRDTLNSIIVTFSATGLALLIGVPAGYGVAKAKATGSATLILLARVTPALSFLIPLYIIFQKLHLLGTLIPLIITHLVLTVPIVVWIMIGFFEGLPPDLEEAALVDGATIWQAFLRVAMPLARPGITVATILAFIGSWNNFVFGVVLAGRTTRTLPVAVYNSMTFEQVSWGPLAAAALVVTAPVLVLTLVMQKQIVAGLTAGGVKGG
jgi:multiple sugar transport system permease protein